MRRALLAALPEWQIFIRRPDGRGEHFTFTRRKQLAALGGVAAISLWAVTSTLMLMHQPEEVASKERRLEEQMASYHAAQSRLDAAQKMVGDITREIDAVHTNLTVLAETNAQLSKERPAGQISLAKLHVGADPAYDDASQPGGSEAKAVRDEVRKLETALDRLRVTYARAVQITADMAGQRIQAAERSLGSIGLDPSRVVANSMKDKGQGGPFIPLGNSAASLGDGGLDTLVERMDRWTNVKMALQTVPLAEPLHVSWEVNSPFGARHDPLNNRTGIHEGVDMGAPYGTPVYATATGTVRMAGPFDRYGLTIDIDHGNGLSTRYAHLSRIKVAVGQKVTRSTVIGLLGSSGRSTGAHLHYEVRTSGAPHDPLRYISVGRDASKAR